MHFNLQQKKYLIDDIKTFNFEKSLDVIAINNMIFKNRSGNSKQKAYSPIDVKFILQFQIVNNLNDVETSKHFNMSRNTLSSWKKKYLTNNLKLEPY